MKEVTAEMIEHGRSRGGKDADRKAALVGSVRDTREKLTSSGSGLRRIDIELLRQYAQARKIAAPATVGLALTVAALSTSWVHPAQVLTWFSMVAIASLYGFKVARNYLELSTPSVDVQLWQRKFVISELMIGVVWALLVVFLLNVQEPDARTFVLFVLLLVAAMSAMMSAAIPYAVYSGILPITLAIVILLQFSQNVKVLPMVVLAIITQVYFAVLAKRLYASNLASLLLQREKDGLIGELEQAKASSDEARRRAEEANLAKSRFLATMSHELRTPLNAILGFSEVMKNELFGAHVVPSYKNYSDDIHSSGQHLLMLINEILDLSRVEAGRYELKEEPLSIPAIIEDCVHLVHMRAEKRDIQIHSLLDSNMPKLWADERAVRQIALNLLTNAIKFTPQGGKVTVKAGWTLSGGQYMSIRDTGSGIPENEIETVLSSFGRGTMAHKNADEGSGLGLPIVKGLVELHGGTFKIKSKVREGTEVIVVFPSQRIMDAMPQLSDEDKPESASPSKTPARKNAA